MEVNPTKGGFWNRGPGNHCSDREATIKAKDSAFGEVSATHIDMDLPVLSRMWMDAEHEDLLVEEDATYDSDYVLIEVIERRYPITSNTVPERTLQHTPIYAANGIITGYNSVDI